MIISLANIANAQEAIRSGQKNSGGASGPVMTIGDVTIGNGGNVGDVGDVATTTPTPGSDNPPPYRDPADSRKIMTMTCSGRTKQTIPGWLYGWDCTSSMSCSCSMTYRDDSGRVLTCAASPMSSSPSGTGSSRSSSQSGRNACIAAADADADSQRDAFFASCAAALANCPP